MTGAEATDDNIKRRVDVERWMTMATGTYSKYVALTAFRRQQWLRERSSMLLYTCNASLVTLSLVDQLLESCLTTVSVARIVGPKMVG